MPQISLYVSEDLLETVKFLAGRNNTSISKYVQDVIEQTVKEEKRNRIASYFGALKDVDFEIPEDIPIELDGEVDL